MQLLYPHWKMYNNQLNWAGINDEKLIDLLGIDHEFIVMKE